MDDHIEDIQEKRTVKTESGTEYEVTHALHLGDREIVFCLNIQAQNNAYYLVSNNQPNEILDLYTDTVGFDDYLEAMSEFTARVNTQIEKVAEQRKSEVVDFKLIQAEQCHSPIGADYDGKVLAIDPASLRGEYRTLSHQIVLCTGGNGAKAHRHGTKVFTKSLDTGHNSWFRRPDILGEIKPEHLPKWAKERLAEVSAGKVKADKNKSQRR